jgi:hydrogenase expression/formation protein HypD
MRYVDEFRDKRLVGKLVNKIKNLEIKQDIQIMEVCGTHTVNFFKFGLHNLIPASLKMIAGPGCPVCVSPQDYIDKAIAYSNIKDIIISSFGDLIRVPGENSSLDKERAKGKDIRIVYSPWQVLEIAKDNPHKKVLFLAVGFETTAPSIALTIKEAKRRKLKNLFFLLSLKRMPPVMEYLLNDREIKIQGFLCPGHVSTIIGVRPYERLVKKYKINCCITGFEPLDILEGIFILLNGILEKKSFVFNQYKRLVRKEGNPKALRIINEVFKIASSFWRGIGEVKESGFILQERYADFDIEKIFPIKLEKKEKINPCRCGDVLKGKIDPSQCPLYIKKCNPTNPFGPCMVSQEGACYAWYHYHQKEN